jgi:hypothetical protein
MVALGNAIFGILKNLSMHRHTALPRLSPDPTAKSAAQRGERDPDELYRSVLGALGINE